MHTFGNMPPDPSAIRDVSATHTRAEPTAKPATRQPPRPVEKPYQPSSTIESVLTEGKGLGAKRLMRVELNAARAALARAGTPLVSCLMVTANRSSQARIAVECYRRQTWPRRQLVIVDTGTDGALGGWIATLNDPSINFKRLPLGKLTLGDIRNLVGSRARGDFVCIWDDDDLHHPLRIEAQMAALHSVQAAACVLGRVTIWWPALDQLSASIFRPWEGTLLSKRAAMPRYNPLDKDEDTPAVNKLLSRERVIHIDAPELYVYVRHSTNTWDESHFHRFLSESKTRYTANDYVAMLNRLATAYPVRGYLDVINTQVGRTQHQSRMRG